MFRSFLFKGFKRSGNHLIIFNIINNIINDSYSGPNELSSLGTYMFYNHDKKIIFFNCLDAHFVQYRNLFRASIEENSVRKENLINEINTFFEKNNNRVLPEHVSKFLECKVRNDYTIFFSIEDTVDIDENKLLDDFFDKNDYNSNTHYIIRDIENLYSSRKASGWMEIGESFIKKYIDFYYSSNGNFINFKQYVTDVDYRIEIHEKFNIINNHLFPRNVVLPVGVSSYENSDKIFDRTDTLDDSDKLLLSISDLKDIKIKID